VRGRGEGDEKGESGLVEAEENAPCLALVAQLVVCLQGGEVPAADCLENLPRTHRIDTERDGEKESVDPGEETDWTRRGRGVMEASARLRGSLRISIFPAYPRHLHLPIRCLPPFPYFSSPPPPPLGPRCAPCRCGN